MNVALVGSTLHGVVQGASLSVDAGSRWVATAASKVTLTAPFDPTRIDAPEGVTIDARPGDGVSLSGSHKLAGGGWLKMVQP